MAELNQKEVEYQAVMKILDAIERNAREVEKLSGGHLITSKRMTESIALKNVCNEVYAEIANARKRWEEFVKKVEEGAKETKHDFETLIKELTRIKDLVKKHRDDYEGCFKESSIESKAFQDIKHCFTELEELLTKEYNAKRNNIGAANAADLQRHRIRNELKEKLIAHSRNVLEKHEKEAYTRLLAELKKSMPTLMMEEQGMKQLMSDVKNALSHLLQLNPQFSTNYNDLFQRFETLNTDFTGIRNISNQITSEAKLFDSIHSAMVTEIENIFKEVALPSTEDHMVGGKFSLTGAEYAQKWKTHFEELRKKIESYYGDFKNRSDPNRNINAQRFRELLHNAMKLLDAMMAKIDEVVNILKAEEKREGV